MSYFRIVPNYAWFLTIDIIVWSTLITFLRSKYIIILINFIETKKINIINDNGVRWTSNKENEGKVDIDVIFLGQNKLIIFPIFIETKKTNMIYGNGVRWTSNKETEYKVGIDAIF